MKDKNIFYIFILLLCIYSKLSFSQTGVIDGYADVNNYGAATYTIPIKVPNSNNLIPDLALQYNSQAGNGLLGMGFSLTGLSVIEYDNKNIFQDGVAEGIDISKNNPFLLDGHRLMLKSGTYGTTGTTYGTEIETFITVTSMGSFSGCTSCPQYFTVKTKSGVIMEYGNTTDSRFMSTDGTRPIYWRLNKMTDVNGNYITYSYINTDGQPRIDEINYTGNTVAGVAPYNKIKFSYITRTDQNTKYFSGTGMTATPVNQKYILDKITITTEGGVLFKTYECTYQTNGRYTFLASLNEKGSDGTSLKPLSFSIGSYRETNLNNNFTTNTLEISLPSSINITNADILKGNFYGSGDEQLLLIYHNGQTPKIYTGYKILSTVNNSYELILQGNITNTSTYNYRGFQIGDFDGNGKDDIVMYKDFNNGNFNGITILYSNNGSNFGFTSQDYNFSQTNTLVEYENTQGVDKYGYVGDFDGDGRSDILTMQTNNYDLNIHFIGKNILNQLTSNPQIIGGQNKIAIVDVDNDRRNEFLVTDDGGGTVFKINNISSNTYSLSDFFYSNNTGFNSELNVGDFNGDNKVDVFGKANNNNWVIGYSTGNSYDIKTFPYSANINTTFGSNLPNVLIEDYNGDGKDDILLSLTSNTSIVTHMTFISNGVNFNINTWSDNSEYYTYFI